MREGVIVMVPVTAGFLGLGLPEMMFISALVFGGIVVAAIVARMSGNRPGPSRSCPHCLRALAQAADAPFCSWCGKRLR